MINEEIKKQIVEAAKDARSTLYHSQSKMAIALDVNPGVLNRLLSGETDRILSDAKWVSIARRLGVNLTGEKPWKTAHTTSYQHIYAQLDACQARNTSALLCDMADIGKTYTARCYVKENKFAVYIDCSQVKTKQKLIREIAKEFGVGNTGKYADVYGDLVFYLRTIPNPLIILDEAGDLDYPAFLELKALWNATEGACGYYMMGADGLKAKIERALNAHKVGYAELFSRFGSRYQRVSPDGKEALDEFKRTQVALVAKANREDINVQELIGKVNGSLRRVKIEISKLN
jgi:hypothetical protein